jgi:phosphotransferase system  glucose/maltose/N-acetylglucosamine-specific IIC component
MKRSWYATVDGLVGPLVMYFIAMILLGIGNSFTPVNEFTTNLLEGFRYAGGLMKTFFPLFLTINIIGKRHEDSLPVMGGFFCYFLLHLTTMFIVDQNYPDYYYFGIQMGSMDLTTAEDKLPLNLGVLASLLVIPIIIITYRISRQRFNYGVFRFISNDAYFLILAFAATIGVGIVVSLCFPYFVNVQDLIFQFVSDNSSNPAALFIYGLSERVLEILGLGDEIHSAFWFGSLGGIWTDPSGVTYNGDVAIWTAQLAQNNLQVDTGKFITPYYIVNIFMVPGVLLGLFSMYSSKLERRKMFGLLVLAVITSFFSSSLVPLEYLTVICSPVLFVETSLLSSTLYGLFVRLGISLGYNYSGLLAFATPGTLLEFIRLSSLMSSTTQLRFFLVGGVYLALSVFAVWLYFRVLAQDFLEGKKKERHAREMIKALGGHANIRIVDYSPFSLRVTLNDPALVNKDAVMAQGASRIKETFFYDDISYGPGSVTLGRLMRKELKGYQELEPYLIPRAV